MVQPNIKVCTPSPADAVRIAAIHLSAMDSNPLLHAQFPTPESLSALRNYLETYTAYELTDPSKGILLARFTETNEIVSFAKWDYPSSADADEKKKDKLENGDITKITGCRQEYLARYAEEVANAKERCWGNKTCYSLTFVCTDPKFGGIGAGRMLTREVMQLAGKDGVPVYLESTMMAVGVYESLGFKELDHLSTVIPARDGKGEIVYEEVCMAWWP